MAGCGRRRSPPRHLLGQERLLKEPWQITPTIEDPLNPHGVAQDPEKDQIIPHDADTRILTYFRAKLICKRLFSDAENLLSDFLEKSYRAAGIILRNESSNGIEIAFNEPGEF